MYINEYTHHINSRNDHGKEITICNCLQSRIKYAIVEMIMYDNATGTILSIPISVRYFPLTNSTARMQFSTATVIETYPIIVRSTIYIINEFEKAIRVPVYENVIEKYETEICIVI